MLARSACCARLRFLRVGITTLPDGMHAQGTGSHCDFWLRQRRNHSEKRVARVLTTKVVIDESAGDHDGSSREGPKDAKGEIQTEDKIAPKADADAHGDVSEGTEATLVTGSVVCGRVKFADSLGADIFIENAPKRQRLARILLKDAMPLMTVSSAQLRKVAESKEPILEVGSVHEFVVVDETIKGKLLLSLRARWLKTAWKRVRQIMEEQRPCELKVVDSNVGGLVGSIEGVRAFLPRSQLISRQRDSRDFMGETLTVLIAEADEAADRLVVSEKRGKAMEALLMLSPGDIIEGHVRELLPYGVFVTIEGLPIPLRGLLHVSAISSDHVGDVGDIFQVGDQLKAMVYDVDIESGRVSLSTQDLECYPGQMLEDPQEVYAKAEESAERVKQEWLEVEAQAGDYDGGYREEEDGDGDDAQDDK
eukprot:jgi/Mesvir1/10014/Mv05806-RA.1